MFANKVRNLSMDKSKTLAFLVHLFTGTGSIFAFMSLVDASNKDWVASFAWLGLALFVDGVDGPIARALKVKSVLPNWSGELLDNIIDYVTYVLIPAFIIYNSGLLSPVLSYLSGIIIVSSSAIYYADTSMKTSENFFKGFPVVWNMLVFQLFIIHPQEWFSFLCIVVSAIICFLPIYFLHPVRVVRLRFINLPVILIWCVLGALALYYNFDSPTWVKILSLIVGLYIYCIGAVMQAFPKLGAKLR